MKTQTPAEHVKALEHQLWCMEQDATAQADFRRFQRDVVSAVLFHLREGACDRRKK